MADTGNGGARRRDSTPCGWCGLPLTQPGQGRRRRYCSQSCRQRAYEQRTAVQRTGLPADAVVLSSDEVAALTDRMFQLRCAAEDLMTAVTEGARPNELRRLGAEVVNAARTLERLRGA